MASQTKVKTAAAFDSAKYQGLDRDALIRLYRTMFLSRRLDDREIQLKRQNKIFFQISGAGHEAVLVAAGLVLKPGYDWFFPYYRDRALALMLGVTPYEMLLQAVGAKDDPSSSGRQMPSHWGNQKLNIVTGSSPTGTRWLHAVGAAEASLYYEKFPKALEQARSAPLGDAVSFHRDEMVYVSGGEGSTSEGEFFEALNAASCAAARSLPRRRQRLRHLRPRRSADRRRQHLEARREFSEPAYRRMRRHGPARKLRRAETRGRPLPRAQRPGAGSRARHAALFPLAFRRRKTLQDRSERDAEARRDPIPKFGLFLVREGMLEEGELEALEAEVDREIIEATDRALAAESPSPDSIYSFVYSPDVDPTGKQFEAQPKAEGHPKTMVEIISATLLDEMARDERIVVFGEDVADCSREENLASVKGKGGVFKATAGLQRRYGSRAFSIRRSPKRPSSVARSAWPFAG